MKAYYHRRAQEYDDWWLGRGDHAARVRPGFDQELADVVELLRGLPPVRTLDVACGTGFLTRHLSGEVVGIDASHAMIAVAREQAPHTEFVIGDALDLPFPDGGFDRVFSSYFYCHLAEPERLRFLAEARRVAPELIVMASVPGEGDPHERWEERSISDGSRWLVYKRVFPPDVLAEELGGRVIHAGRWFVLVRA